MVEIYPNPAGDILYVQHNPGKVNSLEILNLDGKEQSIQMKIKEETGIEINTQKLKSGTLGNQKLDSMIYNRFNYDNNQFFFDTKSSYTYDSNGNLTLDISSWYDSTYQWVMSDKSEYGTIRTITGLRPFPIPSKLPPANGW